MTETKPKRRRPERRPKPRTEQVRIGRDAIENADPPPPKPPATPRETKAKPRWS